MTGYTRRGIKAYQSQSQITKLYTTGFSDALRAPAVAMATYLQRIANLPYIFSSAALLSADVPIAVVFCQVGRIGQQTIAQIAIKKRPIGPQNSRRIMPPSSIIHL